MSKHKVLKDYTVVMANQQTNGRGQMGAKWVSEPYKNLTFSVFKEVAFLNINQQYYINIAVSLALAQTLNPFLKDRIAIKWPNDILADSKKMAGILIETRIYNRELKHAIIGIGININQTLFNTLPSATSLKLILGQEFDLEMVLEQFICHLKKYFDLLESKKFKALMFEYQSYLFKLDKPSLFKDSKGKVFNGEIKGVTCAGKLQVLDDTLTLREFDTKEITLEY